MSFENFSIKQKKSLSQIFLKNKSSVYKTVQVLQTWKVNRVLEIGAGSGILTFELLKNGLEVIAVEKDYRFCELLNKILDVQYLSLKSNIKIINDDILKLDLNLYIDESNNTLTNSSFAVVGNIPYKISTPILQWLFKYFSKIKGAILMLQKEFAQRLVAAPSTKEYSSLSVFVQTRANVRIESIISAKSFKPQPKVDSALVVLMPKENKEDDIVLDKLQLVTKTSFAQRRKTIKNSLKQYLSLDSCVEDIPVNLSKRADALSCEEYIMLTKYLMAKKLL